MAVHDGRIFSTFDHNNNNCGDNCPVLYNGAWWYSCCHHSNLNGVYYNSPSVSFGQGLIWYYFRGNHESMKACKMLITSY